MAARVARRARASIARIVHRFDAGAVIQPHDIAKGVLYLDSNDAMVHGVTLYIWLAEPVGQVRRNGLRDGSKPGGDLFLRGAGISG
jgi:hypothetical protein